jgi:branched-chain amino acid transport system substrate-binding protein
LVLSFQIANGMTNWAGSPDGRRLDAVDGQLHRQRRPCGEGAYAANLHQEPTTPKRQSFIINTGKPSTRRTSASLPVSAAQGYDSIYLLAAAIKQANLPTAQ